MRKPLFILLLLIFLHALSSAQTPVAYGYDPNGNRTLRKIAVLPQPPSSGGTEETLARDTIRVHVVTIYSNPTDGIFSFGVTNLDTKQQNYSRLYNIKGRLLLQQPITSERTYVNITGKLPGMYLLDIYLGGEVSRWKIIKR